MRAGNLIIGLIVLVVGVGVAGYALGWFNVSTSPNDGKSGLTVTLDPDKIKQDRDTVLGLFRASRDEYQKKTETRLEKMDRSLDELKAKANTASAETKEQLNETISELDKKTQVARADLKDLGAATKEDYDASKTRLSASMDELQGRFEKASSRFQ